MTTNINELLGGINVEEGISDSRDSVSYFLDSGIYDMVIEHAYFREGDSGTKGIEIKLVDSEDPTKSMRQFLWFANSEGRTSHGESNRLYPTTEVTKDLLEIVNNEELSPQVFSDAEKLQELFAFEPKTIEVYDFEARAELPTEVLLSTTLTGEIVKVGIIKEVSDNYKEPSKSRTQNIIDKIFDPNTGQTVLERRTDEEAIFGEKVWRGRDSTYVSDRRKQSKDNDARSFSAGGKSNGVTDRIKKLGKLAKK